MDLTRNPERLDRLATSYALGTLRGGARRRFEALAREHASIRAVALMWQMHLAGLNELQIPQTPDAAVWTRIDNMVRAELHEQALRRTRSDAAQVTQARPSSWWDNLH